MFKELDMRKLYDGFFGIKPLSPIDPMKMFLPLEVVDNNILIQKENHIDFVLYRNCNKLLLKLVNDDNEVIDFIYYHVNIQYIDKLFNLLDLACSDYVNKNIGEGYDIDDLEKEEKYDFIKALNGCETDGYQLLLIDDREDNYYYSGYSFATEYSDEMNRTMRHIIPKINKEYFDIFEKL